MKRIGTARRLATSGGLFQVGRSNRFLIQILTIGVQLASHTYIGNVLETRCVKKLRNSFIVRAFL
jgi:hypothetical protein